MPFSAIIGQDAAVSVLTRSLATGKIAHAYIFEGVEGCGKRKTALAFVQAVFCNGAGGCGQCAACRKVAAAQHPDLHILEPDGAFIKIDQIRNLQRELAFRPLEAEKKACIIEAADKMNPAAANAFLKTLEEPPGNALLILLTANIGAVLPTILSRCQRLPFFPISVETIEAFLCNAGVATETARIAAPLAGGSLKKALEIAEEGTLRKRTEALEKISALSLSSIAPLFSLAEELGNDREKVLELLDILTIFWRDVLLLQGGATEVANNDLMPLLRREAEQAMPDAVMERINHISLARHAIQRNVQPRLALEVLFMRLAS